MIQELVDNLIQWYEDSIRLLSEPEMNLDKASCIIKIMNVNIGICNCAAITFDEYIYNDEWIISKMSGINEYWFRAPSNATTIKEIIKCLQQRIDTLKTFEDDVAFNEFVDEHCQKMGDRWGTLFSGDGGKLYTHSELFNKWKATWKKIK